MSKPTEVDFELVPLAVQHKDATLRWMNDPGLMPVLNRLRVITTAEHDAWFASLPGRKDIACFAIEARQPRRHVGNIWLNAIDPVHRKAEVRIMLAPGEHNRGLGSAALARLAEKARADFSLHRLYACVLDTNTSAKRAFERADFHVEGRLRQDRWDGKKFTDVVLLGRIDAA